MTEPGPETADPSQQAKGKGKRWSRLGLFVAITTPIFLVLAIAGLLSWSLSTESGSRFVLNAIERLGGTVTVEGWRGRLLDQWRAERIVVRLPDTRIELHGIEVDWQLRKLWGRQVAIDRLNIDTLHIRSAPSPDEPLTAPASLKLPVTAYVKRLDIGLLTTGELSESGRPLAADQELRAISGRLDSDGAQHHVQNLALTWMAGRLTGTARVGTSSPFPLELNAAWAGTLSERKVAFAATANGSLIEPLVKVDINGDGVQGSADLVLQPFEPLPVRKAQVNIVGLNPADFSEQAPRALLDITANLQPRLPPGAPAVPAPSDWAVSGPIEVVNRQVQSADKNGIPVERIEAALDWAAGRLAVQSLVVSLPGAGRITATGSWQPASGDPVGRLLGQIKLAQVDPSRIVSTARAMRINGAISAEASSDRQDFKANLSADDYRLVAEGFHANEVIELRSAQLTAGKSLLRAQGRLNLSGAQTFRVDGSLQHGNPQSFAPTAMAGDINAKFEASGHLSPQWQAKLQLELAESRLGDYPLSGQASAALVPDRVTNADASFNVFGNRLELHGALGRVGDEMQFSVDAPNIDRFASGVKGKIEAKGVVRDTFAQPSGEITLDATGITVDGGVAVDSITARARVEPGGAGAVDARIALTNLSAGEGERQTYVHQAILTAVGTRQSNVIELNAELLKDQTLAARAQGALSADGWQGRLTQLTAKGPVGFVLTEPSSLVVSAEKASLGPSVLLAQNGRIELSQTDWTPSRVVAKGRITGVEVGLELDENQRTVMRGRSLQLGGDWDIVLGAAPTALIRVYREGGDFILQGDQPVALGLRDLDVNVALQDNRLTATALINGSRIGAINAVVSAATQGVGTSVRPDPDAPLVGVVNMAVPSISWVGPLIDQNYRTDGAVRAEFNILGTIANPQGNGRIVGSKIEFALADEGLRLTEGDVLVSFDANRVRLERLSFRSPNSVEPPDPRLAAMFRDRSGTIQGSGELVLQTGEGDFRINATRVGVLQRPDQWVIVSGIARIQSGWDRFDMNADLRADAGFIGVQKGGRPELSDDVVVRGREPQEGKPMKVNAAVAFNFGDRFILRAYGIDTFLNGNLRIQLVQGSPPLGFGSVQARNGVFEAYGQRLAIDRGVVNFSGPLDNPGLNVVAIRQGLAVEAGVEVTGTAQNPRVRLVSDPNVPDSEKLSWILLGRPTEIGAGDAGLLLSAASAAFGDGGEGAVDRVARGLGLDEIGIGQGSGGALRPLDSRVASSATGLGSSISTPGSINEQVLTIGKRLSSRAYLALEQNLTGTESIVKLTYQLSRYLAVIGRAGTENAVDLNYSISFR